MKSRTEKIRDQIWEDVFKLVLPSFTERNGISQNAEAVVRGASKLADEATKEILKRHEIIVDDND